MKLSKFTIGSRIRALSEISYIDGVTFEPVLAANDGELGVISDIAILSNGSVVSPLLVVEFDNGRRVVIGANTMPTFSQIALA